jgi:hypothetical protein
MYEPTQSLVILYRRDTMKIYARAVINVSISSTESIPYPSQDDIVITDMGAAGKDIEIDLHVSGTASGGSRDEELTVTVPVLDPGEELDEQGVRDAIGTQVFNVNTIVYKDNEKKGGTSGSLDSSSNIIIE